MGDCGVLAVWGWEERGVSRRVHGGKHRTDSGYEREAEFASRISQSASQPASQPARPPLPSGTHLAELQDGAVSVALVRVVVA